VSRQYQDSFKSRSNHELAPVFRDMICKKDNLRLAVGACRTDRLHSVRVACQYKEILENEREMCGFFATAGLSYSFNKRSSRAGRRAGREINQRGKLFLRSMGTNREGTCGISRNFLETRENTDGRRSRWDSNSPAGITITAKRNSKPTGGTSEQVYVLIVLVGNLATQAAN
jgi:hypothetical protein